MKLSQLAKAAAPYVTSLSEDCHIGALSADSRLKTDRGLFFCVKGARTDGHAHAAEAVKNGAIALMVTQPIKDIPVPQLLVSDDRAAMALLTPEPSGYPLLSIQYLQSVAIHALLVLVPLMTLADGFRPGLRVRT